MEEQGGHHAPSASHEGVLDNFYFFKLRWALKGYLPRARVKVATPSTENYILLTLEVLKLASCLGIVMLKILL